MKIKIDIKREKVNRDELGPRLQGGIQEGDFFGKIFSISGGGYRGGIKWRPEAGKPPFCSFSGFPGPKFD